MQELGGIPAHLDVGPSQEGVDRLKYGGRPAGREPGEVTLAAEHLKLLGKPQRRQRRVQPRTRRGAEQQPGRPPILRRRGKQLQPADVQITGRHRQ